MRSNIAKTKVYSSVYNGLRVFHQSETRNIPEDIINFQFSSLIVLCNSNPCSADNWFPISKLGDNFVDPTDSVPSSLSDIL